MVIGTLGTTCGPSPVDFLSPVTCGYRRRARSASAVVPSTIRDLVANKDWNPAEAIRCAIDVNTGIATVREVIALHGLTRKEAAVWLDDLVERDKPSQAEETRPE